MEKITDQQLIDEMNKRFIVVQWYEKEDFESSFNDDEEIDEKTYQTFKSWLQYQSNYVCDIDNVMGNLWSMWKEMQNV